MRFSFICRHAVAMYFFELYGCKTACRRSLSPRIMKRTFLYDSHISRGAAMAPFGGFEMPIRYEGILAEHFAARKAAAIFDTCHMGEFSITGPAAAADLDKIVSCPVASMKTGQCRYGFICNRQGGVLDDQIVYRLGETEFFMVVNASTQDADFKWIKLNISSETSLKNLSSETGKVDLQGPLSPKIINKLLERPIDDLSYYRWMHNEYKGQTILVSRTGYTGEIGFEIYLDERHTVSFWDDCIALGAQPAGLGARDTLRLEMGFPLYGHELDETRNAAESGFKRALGPHKEFIGSPVVLDSRNVHHLLCGIKLDGRRTARTGDVIRSTSGKTTGVITSGSFSPSLECAIAMGYIVTHDGVTGNKVIVAAERSDLTGIVVEMPFYKSATARQALSAFLA